MGVAHGALLNSFIVGLAGSVGPSRPVNLCGLDVFRWSAALTAHRARFTPYDLPEPARPGQHGRLCGDDVMESCCLVFGTRCQVPGARCHLSATC